MLRRMHPDDAGHDRLDNTTDDDADVTTERSLWWALHRPETYALAALVMAVTATLGSLPGFEIAQAFNLGIGSDFRRPLAVAAAVRLGVAVLAAALAVLSIRHEDEDVSWSAPVARAALVVALVAAIFALIVFTGLLINDDDTGYRF
jgi:hypothetical protein